MNKMSEIIIGQKAVTSPAPHLHGTKDSGMLCQGETCRDDRCPSRRPASSSHVFLAPPRGPRPLFPWQRMPEKLGEGMCLRVGKWEHADGWGAPEGRPSRPAAFP